MLATRQFLPDSEVTSMNRLGKLFRSKTVWGSILAAGAWLIAQPAINAPEIVQAVGTVLAAIGVKDSFIKNFGK